MGIRIAETMTEIFRGLPPGHMLFEQFSFVSAEELPVYEALLRRLSARARRPRGRDRTRLLALPLAYIEPRHRLGLLDDALQDRLAGARPRIRAALESLPEVGVEFFDPERVSAAAPLRDNLLFGRIDTSAANAQVAVTGAMSAVIADMGLRPDVERVGLDHQVGPSGRNLNNLQRAGVNLVRCLVKRPDLLVVDGALAPFGEVRARAVGALLLEMCRDRTLAMALPNDRDVGAFDTVLRVQGKTVVMDSPKSRASNEAAPVREPERGRRLAGVAP
jgi:putative ABC transport system ATP-binding protein